MTTLMDLDKYCIRAARLPDGQLLDGVFLVCRPTATELRPLVRIGYVTGSDNLWAVRPLSRRADVEIIEGEWLARAHAYEVAEREWADLNAPRA